MDCKKELMRSFPIYYDRAGIDDLPFKPFIVVPIKKHQDTLVVAPNYLALSHDKFVNSLYRKVEGFAMPRLAVRAFKFDKEYCIAVLIPISLEDSAGRRGQCIAIGYLIKPDLIGKTPRTLNEAFRLFFRLTNKFFGMSLPDANGDEFVITVDSLSNSEETFTKMETIVDMLLLAATVAAEMRTVYPIKRKNMRLLKGVLKDVPKILLFSNDVDGIIIIEAVINELWDFIPWSDVTALQDCNDKPKIDFLAVQTLDQSLSEVKSARIGKISNKKYLSLS